jgi:competence protein ComEA
MSGFGEWLSNLDSREKWRFFAAAGVLVAASFFILAPQPESAVPTDSATLEINQEQLPLEGMLVHVSGEVIRQGLYELPPGSRVADAIRLAGGFTEEAQSESINLARILTDGEQIIVGSEAQSDSGLNSALVNINSASASELDELPGIGPALASRIVEWRLKFGSFQRLEDLLEVSGIGEKLLSELMPLITR